jgi:hypothetical protein
MTLSDIISEWLKEKHAHHYVFYKENFLSFNNHPEIRDWIVCPCRNRRSTYHFFINDESNEIEIIKDKRWQHCTFAKAADPQLFQILQHYLEISCDKKLL